MAAGKNTPKDAQVMAAILKDMGVIDYEPRVVNQMMEFSYRYITEVLNDAKVYSTHANKKNVDVEDIKLAVQCKLDHSFTNPPPRELLMDVARHKNNIPLPLIKPFSGPKLPPDRYCLTAANYRIKAGKKMRGPTPRIMMSSAFAGADGKPTLHLPTRVPMSVRPTMSLRPTGPGSVVRILPAVLPSSSGSTAISIPQTSGFKRKREEDDDYDAS